MPKQKTIATSVSAALAQPQARTDAHKSIKPLMEIRPQAAAGVVEVLIYGYIGESWWSEGVDAKTFVQKIAGVEADELVIRINSNGGSVIDGAAIYNAIRMHPAAKKTTQIDGTAASIASLIAMAGDSVRMFANTTLMIHAPWAFVDGNENTMREAADTLHTYAEAMATSYAAKSGKSVDDVMALLTDGVDHYYTAENAVAEGFCDEIIDAQPDLSTLVIPEEEEPELIDDPTEEGMQAFRAHAPAIAAQMRMNAFNAMAAHVRRVAGYDPTQSAQAMLERTASQVRASAQVPPRGNSAAPSQEESTMDPTTTAATPAEKTTATVVAALRQRNDDIVAALKPYAKIEGVAEFQVQALADPEMSIDAVRARALEIVGKHAAPANGGGGRVEGGEDASDKFREGLTLALSIRAGLAKDDTANPFRGHSLVEMARSALEQNGKSTRNLSRMDIVAQGFTSTTDFPNVLANVAEKAMLKGWTEAPETFPQFTSIGELSDFKPAKRVDLNVFPSLAQVPEGSEYKYGYTGDRGETVQLATYGRMFSITRQAIINDDLGVFTRIPQKMGRAAKRTVGNLVFAVITGNPNMSDGVALFHANHNNLLTGAAISSTSVDLLRVAMAKQKDPDGNATALNIPLRYLLVPMALGGAARQVANSEFEVGASSKNNTVPNPVRGLFEVIEDARLDLNSASVWYGLANPALFDTIEVSYLDGQSTPYLEQREGWDVDGTEFKVRIDAGVKALDFRSFAKNPGA